MSEIIVNPEAFVLRKGTVSWTLISLFLVVTFGLVCLLADLLTVRTTLASQLALPAPGELLSVSDSYSAPLLKGLRLDPEDPLHIEFIVDTASEGDVSRGEASRLIRYFLAGLTIPQDDLWVNLSPDEADRVIEEDLGATDLGRDMLAQDYVLKQLASSLTHPDTPTGAEYWRQLGDREWGIGHSGKEPCPINHAPSPAESSAFSKIWIVPDSSVVHEQGTMALITEATLKAESESPSHAALLPAITDQLNQGRHFAVTRQLYHSLILAVWFKQKFEESFYSYYMDQGKITGIDIEDKAVKDKIWNLYCEAFRKGVYDVIKAQPAAGRSAKRRYFSGGQKFGSSSLKPVVESGIGAAEVSSSLGKLKVFNISLSPHIGKIDLQAIDAEAEEQLEYYVNEIKWSMRIVPVGDIMPPWAIDSGWNFRAVREIMPEDTAVFSRYLSGEGSLLKVLRALAGICGLDMNNREDRAKMTELARRIAVRKVVFLRGLPPLDKIMLYNWLRSAADAYTSSQKKDRKREERVLRDSLRGAIADRADLEFMLAGLKKEVDIITRQFNFLYEDSADAPSGRIVSSVLGRVVFLASLLFALNTAGQDMSEKIYARLETLNPAQVELFSVETMISAIADDPNYREYHHRAEDFFRMAKVYPEQSTLGKAANFGGIDMKAIAVEADTTSSAVRLAPFDVSRFDGFMFKIVDIRNADAGVLLAMAG
jgi:hypothetical protein